MHPTGQLVLSVRRGRVEAAWRWLHFQACIRTHEGGSWHVARVGIPCVQAWRRQHCWADHSFSFPPAGMAVRQQHFGNGSVELSVDALLLPPPLPAQHAQQAQQAAAAATGGPSSAPGPAQPAERGTLLLLLTSQDGSKHWQAAADVASLPADADAAAAACRAESESSGSGGSGGGACPWPWSAPDGGCGAGEGGEAGGGALPVLPPVKHTLSIILDSP